MDFPQKKGNSSRITPTSVSFWGTSHRIGIEEVGVGSRGSTKEREVAGDKTPRTARHAGKITLEGNGKMRMDGGNT